MHKTRTGNSLKSKLSSSLIGALLAGGIISLLHFVVDKYKETPEVPFNFGMNVGFYLTLILLVAAFIIGKTSKKEGEDYYRPIINCILAAILTIVCTAFIFIFKLLLT
ncbi:hypothetical protein R4575_18205 [Acinetobacter baumannii]|jgi:hypothetical protein|nr:hypothetical protein [Acinetobacter baumannii]